MISMRRWELLVLVCVSAVFGAMTYLLFGCQQP